jgi:YidC/Oxa1 family membrane protein insertase
MWDRLITEPFVNVLLWIYDLLWNNFGLAVILFTIIIRMATYPLTVSQQKGAKAMQELQKSKEYQELQKKYKDNREKLQQEQMKLIQKMGVNPFASCLPTLIQFPIMIGLYQAIVRALSVTPFQLLDLMKHVYPFIDLPNLIPINKIFLWMDLSLPEKNFGISIAGIGIPIIAILVVITTYIQSKLITPPSTTPGDQSAQMTQSMNLMMPLLMGYISYSYSSGLALYFLVSNLIGIIQYSIMGKVSWRNLLPKRLVSQGGNSRTKSEL